jgi:hypothetical protein
LASAYQTWDQTFHQMDQLPCLLLAMLNEMSTLSSIPEDWMVRQLVRDETLVGTCKSIPTGLFVFLCVSRGDFWKCNLGELRSFKVKLGNLHC